MAKDSLKVIQDCHKLLLWIIPRIDKFPRHRRYTLGERIEEKLLLVLELLSEAAYQSNKAPFLSKANSTLVVVRHLWRLAFELGAVSSKQYEFGGRQLFEIGNQTGAWLKSTKR